MDNPSCPFGCGTVLRLEVHDWRSSETLKKPDLQGHFYVCHSCKKHWPRSAAIMRVTARDGLKPKPKKGL